MKYNKFRAEILSNYWNDKTPKGRNANFLRPSFYCRNIETIPIVILVTYAMTVMTYCIVKSFTRTEIVLSRHGFKSKTQGELIELLLQPKYRKFFHYNQTYPVNKPLYDTYRAMEEAKKKREKKCENREAGIEETN